MKARKRIVKVLTAIILSLVLVGEPNLLIPQMSQIATVKAASRIKLNKSEATLIKGTRLKLRVDGTTDKVRWNSSNKAVAIVDSKGVVTARAKGTAKITAKVANQKYTCKVTVETPKISKKTASINVGQKLTLKLNGTKQKVKWSTSKKSVATVSSKGLVTGKKAGTATITAKVGEKKYTCKVTVKENKQPVLSVSSNNVVVNEKASVTVTFTEFGNVTCNIEDKSIVSCKWEDFIGTEAKLIITGEKEGTTNIVIGNTYNNETCVIKVRVTKAAEIGREELSMAAYGIAYAYLVAKYPSTLHINRIQYEKDVVTGYGDHIKRMVVKCYAQNNLGGYADLYVVVIKCDSNEHYPDAYKYGDYYINTSSYSNNPGMNGSIMDNQTALEAYQYIFNTNRVIPYD